MIAGLGASEGNMGIAVTHHDVMIPQLQPLDWR